jgi:Predicted transcription factor, homolog of eukaryotic MBF1
MPSCELCGKDSNSLTKTKIEGATLKACESCAEMGDKVETESNKGRKKKTGDKSRTRNRNTKTLAPNYGEKVKEAREDERLSVSEVADDLNEKESVIKKIEKEDLKPDQSLASKISGKFNISLYTNTEVSNVDTESGDSRKATLGDVAEVKE